MENESIKQTQKMHKCVLAVFIFFQVIFIVFINLFLKSFFEGEEVDPIENIMKIVSNVFAISVFLFIDGTMIWKIRRYDKLKGIQPIYGTLEDLIILTSGRSDNRTRDLCYLIKSREDGKLYLSKGGDDMSGYTYSFSGTGTTLQSIHIFKKDGKESNIGDTVRVYILEKHQESPATEILGENKIKIKGRRHLYQHVNQKYSIDVFEECVFYKGYVELLSGTP